MSCCLQAESCGPPSGFLEMKFLIQSQTNTCEDILQYSNHEMHFEKINDLYKKISWTADLNFKMKELYKYFKLLYKYHDYINQ